VGEAEGDEFEVVVGRKPAGLSLEVSLMKEERRRKKMGSKVRGERVSRVSRQVEKEGRARTNLQVCSSLLSFINFGLSCSGIGVASLIRIPNSKFNNR